MPGGYAKLRIKNAVKQTGIGKKLRDRFQRRKNYTRKDAEAFAAAILKDREEASHLKAMAEDMMREREEYDISFDEYFMFHFYGKSFDERREYVSELERIRFCEMMNRDKNMILFDDKGATYKKFRPYYHRDLVECFGKWRDGYGVFLKRHPRFIVKPFDGACGKGIRIVDSRDRDPKEVFQEISGEYKNGFVAEELIVQSGLLGQFHPSSVNTLRMTTILYKDRVDVIHPFLRTGVGGSCVDNGGSGGIICALSPSSGIVTVCEDEKGQTYTRHPDTGLELVGFQVPRWEEALKLAKELARVVPDNHYCGWDLALTDDGWILQEANDRGGFIGFQLEKGFRKELMGILRELGLEG